MDPTANLEEQRELIRVLVHENEEEYVDTGDLLRLAELTEAMDKWLSNGGFLPEAWER